MALIAVALGASQAAPQTDGSPGDPQLDVVVERAMRQHRVPGASVAVVRNGRVAWAKGYGLADPAQRIRVMPDTVFEAASVSKPVTAWGIMKLVEEGKLDLDAPIERYLTRWHLPRSSRFDLDQVTIRRILSHTAGLSGGGDVGVEPGERLPTMEEALNGAVVGMRALHVASPPGEDYYYSSLGYTLLELAVEKVTGEPFAAYMKRVILNPLGMTHSSFDRTPELRAKTAVGHDWHNNPLPEYRRSTRAQGGLLSTAADLAIFLAASMPGPNGEPIGRGVLTPASVAEMFAPVPFVKQAASNHVAGLGHDLIRVNGTILGARKTGDNRGYKPLIVTALAAGEGVAIMTNSDRASMGFVLDIACAWSERVNGNPLRADCRELMMIRNVQFIVAGLLALGALVYGAFVVRGALAGHRRFGWDISRGGVVRVVVLLALLAAWWILWYTDILFHRVLGTLPKTAVTVRVLVPWPTAFIWISWAVTLWLLAWIATTFGAKVKKIQ